jgi:hypothetical protein
MSDRGQAGSRVAVREGAIGKVARSTLSAEQQKRREEAINQAIAKLVTEKIQNKEQVPLRKIKLTEYSSKIPVEFDGQWSFNTVEVTVKSYADNGSRTVIARGEAIFNGTMFSTSNPEHLTPEHRTKVSGILFPIAGEVSPEITRAIIKEIRNQEAGQQLALAT